LSFGSCVGPAGEANLSLPMPVMSLRAAPVLLRRFLRPLRKRKLKKMGNLQQRYLRLH